MTTGISQISEFGPTTDVTHRRLIEAPPPAVWRSMTEATRLPVWRAPVPIELRADTLFEIDFGEDGGLVTGRITDVEPERRLAYTWQILDEPESAIDVSFEPAGDGTLVALAHRGLSTAMGIGYATGWHAYFDQVEALASGHDVPDWQDRFEDVLSRYTSPA